MTHQRNRIRKMTGWKAYSDDEYIPRKITVGKFSSEDFGFVTCKYKGLKWLMSGIFERLCGFKPHTQRDPEKQLTKEITQNVQELDNSVPLEGFKFLGEGIDPYDFGTFRGNGQVVLEDPREFKISIPRANFFNLLALGHGNLENWELKGLRLQYVFGEDGSMSLISTEDPEYESLLKRSEELESSLEEVKFITQRNLEVGKLYRGNPENHFAGVYMYLGKHTVFSNELQLQAFQKRGYLEPKTMVEGAPWYAQASLRKETEKVFTGSLTEKHVFYRILEPSGDEYFKYSRDHGDYLTPYVCLGNISKLLYLPRESESKLEIPKNLGMYNSETTPVTLENIQADMKRSVMFNKIDFSNSSGLREISLDSFKTISGLFGETDAIPTKLTYPLQAANFLRVLGFSEKILDPAKSAAKTTVRAILKKDWNDGRNGRAVRFSVTDGHHRPSYSYSLGPDTLFVESWDSVSDDECERMWSKLKLQIPDVVLENGEHVDDIHAAVLANGWF